MASISPVQILRELYEEYTEECAAQCAGSENILSESFPELMDKHDELAKYREQFQLPNVDDLPYETDPCDSPVTYFLGHSLGLKPNVAEEEAKVVFDNWGKYGGAAHHYGEIPFITSDQPAKVQLAKMIGAADVSEIAVMNSLTVNLQLLLMAFYKPHEKRNKILIEDRAFPSDRYCIQSLQRLYNIKDGLITVMPREGEDVIKDQDIIDTIKEQGQCISLVMLSGVQYYTGQKFDMGGITKTAKKYGCNVGWDLAHAIGNVRLNLNEWGVDFAVWCSYKYLNSSSGGVAGAFVHANHHDNMPDHIDGWFGNKHETLLEMKEDIDYAKGADCFRLSCPAPLLTTIHNASLKIFGRAGMDAILHKQYLLTGYLEHLLANRLSSRMKILTPADPQRRGSMLCIKFVNCDFHDVHEKVKRMGVMLDVRMPNVMRIAPVPLYNTFTEVYRFVNILESIVLGH